MAKCDLCDGRCSASDMTELLPQYQIGGVKDICPACSSWANKTKDRIIGEIAPRMRAEIMEEQGRRPGAARRLWSWLRRSL